MTNGAEFWNIELKSLNRVWNPLCLLSNGRRGLRGQGVKQATHYLASRLRISGAISTSTVSFAFMTCTGITYNKFCTTKNAVEMSQFKTQEELG
jgi:hypothetical protein